MKNETVMGHIVLDEKYLYFKYIQNDAPNYIKQFDQIDEFKNRKIYSFSLIESCKTKKKESVLCTTKIILSLYISKCNAIDVH